VDIIRGDNYILLVRHLALHHDLYNDIGPVNVLHTSYEMIVAKKLLSI
jgi:hypothetical protein